MTAQIITLQVITARLKNDIHQYNRGEVIRVIPFCGKMIVEDDLERKNKRIIPFEMIDIKDTP